MKKKIRTIVVSCRVFKWCCKEYVDECELPYTRVRVWDDTRKLIANKICVDLGVTPKAVRSIIESVIP